MITGLNHAVLYVRDARVHERFYRDMLGFTTVSGDPDGRFAFMQAPRSHTHHDIAFFSIGSGAGTSTAGRTTVGMYHLAWQVTSIEDLASMRDRLSAGGALVGASDHGTSKSLYCQDPDGLEFEVLYLVPADEWADQDGSMVLPLDMASELARYGNRSS